jgi:hypothetical protein
MLVFRASATYPHFNACVGLMHDTLEATCRGYHRLVELGLKHVLEDQRDLDILLPPIVATWRHYVELRLKLLSLNAAEIEDEIGKIDKTHKLAFLWGKARAMLVRLFPHEAHDEALSQVDEHIAELSEIDPTSMTFRYTIGLDRKSLLPRDLTHVGYVEFAEVFESVSATLEGASCMMRAACDYANDARSETSYF